MTMNRILVAMGKGRPTGSPDISVGRTVSPVGRGIAHHDDGPDIGGDGNRATHRVAPTTIASDRYGRRGDPVGRPILSVGRPVTHHDDEQDIGGDGERATHRVAPTIIETDHAAPTDMIGAAR